MGQWELATTGVGRGSRTAILPYLANSRPVRKPRTALTKEPPLRLTSGLHTHGVRGVTHTCTYYTHKKWSLRNESRKQTLQTKSTAVTPSFSPFYLHFRISKRKHCSPYSIIRLRNNLSSVPSKCRYLVHGSTWVETVLTLQHHSMKLGFLNTNV